jgi:hypothetical protein
MQRKSVPVWPSGPGRKPTRTAATIPALGGHVAVLAVYSALVALTAVLAAVTGRKLSEIILL